jgi:hypothetical protein
MELNTPSTSIDESYLQISNLDPEDMVGGG